MRRPTPIPNVTIYTDGAFFGSNTAWAAILVYDAYIRELSGHMPMQRGLSPLRMEMIAAVHALNNLAVHHNVTLWSDSLNLVGGMTGQSWRRRRHMDLWRILDHLNRKHRVIWRHCPGHAGITWNEHADALARQTRDSGVGVRRSRLVNEGIAG